MGKIKKQTSNGLKILLIVSFSLFALFVVSFLLYGVSIGKANDPQMKDLGEVMKYHFEGIKGLFTFKFHDASNIIYFSLSALLYGLVALWVVFLIVGIIVAKKNKKPVLVYGIVLTFLALVVYLFVATGTPKYWLIVNNRAPYENNMGLRLLVFAVLVFGFIFAVMAYVTYFACVFEAYKKPQVAFEEEPKEEQPVIEEENQPEEPVMFEEFEEETSKSAAQNYDYQEAPAPEYEEDDERITKKDLASIIREIVQDEMSKNRPHESGPLVVQYFGTTPMAQQYEEPRKEEPKKEEKKEPVAAVSRDVEEVKVHDSIVPQEQPAPEYKIVTEEKKEEPAEKNKIIRIPFQTRMINADEEMKKNYNELKNEILSYGVNCRTSNSGDAFRLHRKTYVKITIAGLSLKLYFALNPEGYKDSPIPVQDAGHKGIYAEIPLVFKVKSGLSMRRCKELIQTVMEKDGLEQGPIENIDWVEKLKEQPVDDSPEED